LLQDLKLSINLAVATVEVAKFTVAEKCMSSSQQCQVHVDHFLRHPWYCPQGIHTPWSNCKWQVLLLDFEAVERGHLTQTSRQVEEKQLVSPQ
jgi:hypothetical protein